MADLVKAQLPDLRGGTRIPFHAGCRMLAKVIIDLKKEQKDKIAKLVDKFANEPIRTLIINCLRFKILKVDVDGDVQTICNPTDLQHQTQLPNVLNLSCTLVDFKSQDRLLIRCQDWSNMPYQVRRQIYYQFEEWAGKDVEIIISEFSL